MVRTDFAGNQCLPSIAFGDFGVAAAWSGFSTAWSAELTVTSEAIKELITKVSATADHFANTETHVRASMAP